MSEGADAYFASIGVDIDDGLKHYGKKGMKWGVRNDDSGGSSSGGKKAWTDDQKQKARNVAVIAGTIAVGAAFVALQVYSKSGVGPGASAGASLPSLTRSTPVPKGIFKDVAGTRAAGKKIADDVLKAQGSTKLNIDPELRKFIKDAPSRILSDQKGWSNSLGKSLSKIQTEDAEFMRLHIQSFVPKALGA